MITLSRARHQIPGLERKRYWNSGLARKDLGIFPVPVCLETFRPHGGGYGIAYKKHLDQKYLFFHCQKKSAEKTFIFFSEFFLRKCWTFSKKSKNRKFSKNQNFRKSKIFKKPNIFKKDEKALFLLCFLNRIFSKTYFPHFLKDLILKKNTPKTEQKMKIWF